MPAIIGGSPSTGSSVLVNVLNRHSKIYAGPETHLMSKVQLYRDWKGTKNAIINRSKFETSLKSPGLHRYNGVILDLEKPIRKYLDSSNSLAEFSNQYFGSFGKEDWVDKTPVNSYCFDLFLKEFSEGKVVLSIRNPYDAVASMCARGMKVIKASAIYLANTLANIQLHESDRLHILKYESLVLNQEKTVNNLCLFLGHTYEPEMLKADDEVVTMEGWKQNEKALLGNESVGRFDQIAYELQKEIIAVLSAIRIKSSQWPFKDIELEDINDICSLFGYDYKSSGDQVQLSKMNHWKEQLESTFKGYPTNIFNDPIAFKK